MVRAGLSRMRAILAILLGSMLTLSSSIAATPIITSTQDERITLKVDGVEIAVPIPTGYVRTNHQSILLSKLPVIQDRRIVAAFKQAIDANNVYQVAPEPGQSKPLYYLIYAPKLDAAAARQDDLLAYLETAYFQQGFDKVGATQRFAIQRTDANTLSVTWVDLNQYAVAGENSMQATPANCINTAVYRKNKALIMFDTIEDCGLDADSVRTHGEAWVQRIKTANEPLTYAESLLAEEDAPASEDGAEAPDVQQGDAADPIAEEDDSAAGPLLWVLLGLLVAALAFPLVGRLRTLTQEK